MPGRPGPGTHLPCFPPQKDQVFRASKRSEALARCSVRREAEAHATSCPRWKEKEETERAQRWGPRLLPLLLACLETRSGGLAG